MTKIQSISYEGQLYFYWREDELYLFKKFFSMFIFERERETEHEQRRGREREGDTESEAGSRLRAVSTEPNVGLELTECEIMTLAKV